MLLKINCNKGFQASSTSSKQLEIERKTCQKFEKILNLCRCKTVFQAYKSDMHEKKLKWQNISN